MQGEMKVRVPWSEKMKAVAAAAVALGGTVGTAISDGEITLAEAGVIVGALIAAYNVVFHVKNKPSEPQPKYGLRA